MDAHVSLSSCSGICRSLHSFSISTRQISLTRAVAFVGCLALQGMLPGCVVSQSTHDEALQDIQSLQAANRTLRTALDTAQVQRKRAEQGSPVQTDNRRLREMLSRSVTDIRGKAGAWEIQYRQVPMMVLTSEQHDRMRIMAMVGDESLAKDADLSFLMQANFDRALDARYALLQGKLWSVYLHPLSTLTATELTSALIQVANLVKTYGTTYSSSTLQFQDYK